ncbi:MAG: valine--tRNA ligase [Gemmatimonadales bacterium]|nr:valine--tRNA ligase [Gemmatimonadales bacterium]
MTDPTSLPPQYNPAAIEADLYRSWLAAGAFAPADQATAPPYVIMMPPPNVTAVLHMGHGLNNTVQDVLVRFERMRGRPALWLPGTDHAGIATQNVVEKLVAREGKTRFDLGREEFVRRVWAFVDQTGSTILDQLKAIGSSADWSRTYFTLDEDLSRAVREVFVRLHEKGLIYRGKYIINWCPRCLTALSNEEAEKEETDGRIWRLRYPLADGSGHLTVATTRPETMLGDTAVAVHPEDERYAHLIGRTVRLPLVDREIPIVADLAIDREFGTGAVKVTPAHDPVDFEIGQRHGLPAIDIMTPEARMAETVPERFQGLDRFEARKQVVREFEALGLLEQVDNHRHAVGHCYRCDTVVEPRLSDQWFVRMKPLAEPALQAYTDGRLRFIPERRGEEYANWMGNIRDWCISRQLWWGHRIPVWYCDACGATLVSRTDVTRCRCGGAVRQDEDVLDTWFSSWLVPFSSLGWPDRTDDLRRFYPGSVLVTAPEILFFWVARMVMAGCEFMGDIPFHTVYLHGTVRDTQHRKMSKSLGNGIDPIEVVEKFGADALRYTVIAGMAVGTDVILDPDDLETSFAPGRNFANKVWNAGRFILTNLGDSSTRPLAGPYPDVVRADDLGLADRWIIARCDAMVREATTNYEKFRLNEAASAVYHFLWSDLADWYLEQAKPRLYGSEPGGDVARAVIGRTFEVALAVLHPIMPFVTETLWGRFPGRAADATLSRSAWPRPDARAAAPGAERGFALVQELVGAIRQIRAEYGVEPGKSVNVRVSRAHEAFRQEEGCIRRLAKVGSLSFGAALPEPGANAVLADGTSLYIALGDLVDVQKECERLGTEAARLTQLIEGQRKKLGNEQFVSRAPVNVVQHEREKLASLEQQLAALSEKREQLGCR